MGAAPSGGAARLAPGPAAAGQGRAPQLALPHHRHQALAPVRPRRWSIVVVRRAVAESQRADWTAAAWFAAGQGFPGAVAPAAGAGGWLRARLRRPALR